MVVHLSPGGLEENVAADTRTNSYIGLLYCNFISSFCVLSVV